MYKYVKVPRARNKTKCWMTIGPGCRPSEYRAKYRFKARWIRNEVSVTSPRRRKIFNSRLQFKYKFGWFCGNWGSGRKSALENRLMLHSAARLGDIAAKNRCLKALDNSVEDQLSLAAHKYAERDYTDAINVYKQIIYDDRCPYRSLLVYWLISHYLLSSVRCVLSACVGYTDTVSIQVIGLLRTSII